MYILLRARLPRYSDKQVVHLNNAVIEGRQLMVKFAGASTKHNFVACVPVLLCLRVVCVCVCITCMFYISCI